MQEDYKELVEYLDEKFNHIDERFVKVDNDFKELKGQFNLLQTAVDGYAKKADTYFQEMVMLAHKTERLEKWVKQLAEKLGVKLEY